MLNKIRSYESRKGLTTQITALALIFWVFAAIGYAQTTDTAVTTAQTDQKMTETKSVVVLQPVLTNYKSVKIGTAAAAVRDQLGKAKIDDKDGFYYEKDDELIQIRLDSDKKVRLLVITYLNGNKNAPTYAAVFGAETPMAEKPDGSIYNLVRYPEAGYWVAYSRSAGEKPAVTVTMQKL